MASERKVNVPPPEGDIVAQLYLDLRQFRGDLTGKHVEQALEVAGRKVGELLGEASEWEERQWVEVGVRSVRSFQLLGRLPGLASIIY